MGILNVTPDSFSGDGCLAAADVLRAAVRRAARMRAAGADLIDVGGESSRPGAEPVSPQEEIRRVLPVVRRLVRTGHRVSVDTWKPEVAEEVLQAGAAVINTIRGADPDRRLLKAVRDSGAGLVLMHMRGEPRTMQRRPAYRDVVASIVQALRKSVRKCLETGIPSDRIMIDPGIGFGKTLAHNLEILDRLAELRDLDLPILVGVSRKSFLGRLLDKEVSGRRIGSVVAGAAAVLKGAHVLRVHDVAATREAVVVADAILNASL